MKARGIIDLTDNFGVLMQVRRAEIKAVIWRENAWGVLDDTNETGFFEICPSKLDRRKWKEGQYSLYACENPFDLDDTRARRIKEADKKDAKIRAAAIRKANRQRRAEAEKAATKHRLRHERYAKLEEQS